MSEELRYPEHAPTDLGNRGLAFWNEHSALVETVIAQVRLEEVCRILDELDSLGTDEDGRVERRQQRTLLKGFLSELEETFRAVKPDTMTTTRARAAANARWGNEKARQR